MAESPGCAARAFCFCMGQPWHAVLTPSGRLAQHCYLSASCAETLLATADDYLTRSTGIVERMGAGLLRCHYAPGTCTFRPTTVVTGIPAMPVGKVGHLTTVRISPCTYVHYDPQLPAGSCAVYMHTHQFRAGRTGLRQASPRGEPSNNRYLLETYCGFGGNSQLSVQNQVQKSGRVSIAGRWPLRGQTRVQVPAQSGRLCSEPK